MKTISVDTSPSSGSAVGIFIPTMNRADYLIRQLRYYAYVGCPHKIYICDSSSKEDSEKITAEIRNLQNKINVEYLLVPGLNSWQSHHRAIAMVKEPYACLIGDDDYQIPNALTKCVEFLENNRDYAICGGYAVSFRLKDSDVYGSLKRLADYPRYQIEYNSAAERIIDFFAKIHTTTYSVNRTEELLQSWSKAAPITDDSMRDEVLPISLPMITGKSKVLDCLSFVRQIHGISHKFPGFVEWVTGKEWAASYLATRDILAMELAKKDNISVDKATEIINRAFGSYLAKYASYDSGVISHTNDNRNNNLSLMKQLRNTVAKSFPRLKFSYKKLENIITGRPTPIHYAVLQPGSKYYADFKPVMDSFSGKISL